MSLKLPEGAPRRVGVILFPGFEVLDVFGPIEAFNVLARSLADPHALSLSILAAKIEPISCGPLAPSKAGELFVQTFNPTHTFEDAPPVEVLLVPGGLGVGDCNNKPAAVDPIVEYISKTFPSLKYMITVCTGAGLAARAGALDNISATTNKFRWETTTPLSKKTHWVAHARWVDAGKVWTTSGVSAGTDGTLAWMDKVYGQDIMESVAQRMEYERQKDALHDPFAEIYGCKDVYPS